jgi:hypothetical protein
MYLFIHWKSPIKESCQDVLDPFDLCFIKYEMCSTYFLMRLNVPPLAYTKAKPVWFKSSWPISLRSF